MDLSFSRRRKAIVNARTPDLQVLLSVAAVRQSTSPTARAQALGDRGVAPEFIVDARVDLFAADGCAHADAPISASFAKPPHAPVNPRQ